MSDTDGVDREIKQLRNERRDLISQIRAENSEDRKAELEAMLGQLDSELAQKDNDSYRREHTRFSAEA